MINKKSIYSILIVDDHPIIIEGYTRTINYYNSTNTEFEFKTEIATNIDISIKKIDESITTGNLFNLIILDISLPQSQIHKINSGEM